MQVGPRPLKIGVRPPPIPPIIACLSIGIIFVHSRTFLQVQKSRGKARNIGEKPLSLLCPLNVPFVPNFSVQAHTNANITAKDNGGTGIEKTRMNTE